MGRGRPKRSAERRRADIPPAIDPGAEISRLRRELEEARALLKQVELGGSDAGQLVLAKRMASLEEDRQVARGHAVEASLARSKAEAELRALRQSIKQATGLRGWLLRRASKGL
jgi:hypothetical protein